MSDTNISVCDSLDFIKELPEGESIRFFDRSRELYCFYHGKRRKHLVVAYNGAIDRSRAEKGIVFQRSSWAEEAEFDLLVVSDPTLVDHNNLSIGWGQQEAKGRWFPLRVADLLGDLSDQLGYRPEDRLHFGSSSGGTQALFVAAYDRGSRFLVNHAQFNWLNYDVPSAVVNLLDTVYDGMSPDMLKNTFPERTSALTLFQHLDYCPGGRILVNVASVADFNSQLMTFLSAFQTTAHKFESVIEIALYRDPDVGHSPITKDQTLKEIVRFLNRPQHRLGHSRF